MKPKSLYTASEKANILLIPGHTVSTGLEELTKQLSENTNTTVSDDLEILNQKEIDIIIIDLNNTKAYEKLNELTIKYPGILKFAIVSQQTIKSAIEAIEKGILFNYIQFPSSEYIIKQKLQDAIKYLSLLKKRKGITKNLNEEKSDNILQINVEKDDEDSTAIFINDLIENLYKQSKNNFSNVEINNNQKCILEGKICMSIPHKNGVLLFSAKYPGNGIYPLTSFISHFGILKSNLIEEVDFNSLIIALNSCLLNTFPSNFYCPANIVKVNFSKKILEICNLGSNRLIKLSKNNKIDIYSGKADNIPMGIKDVNNFEIKTEHYHNGDTLYLFSDNNTSIFNEKNEKLFDIDWDFLVKQQKRNESDNILEKTYKELKKLKSKDENYVDSSLMIAKF